MIDFYKIIKKIYERYEAHYAGPEDGNFSFRM